MLQNRHLRNRRVTERTIWLKVEGAKKRRKKAGKIYEKYDQLLCVLREAARFKIPLLRTLL